jgi:hypothetical protein
MVLKKKKKCCSSVCNSAREREVKLSEWNGIWEQQKEKENGMVAASKQRMERGSSRKRKRKRSALK